MRSHSSRYSAVILFMDVLCVVFIAAGAYHHAHKVYLPEEYLRYPSFTLDGQTVSGEAEIEFLTSHYAEGDTVHLAGLPGGEEKTVRLVHFYSVSSMVLDLILVVLIFSVGMFVYLFRPREPASRAFHLVSTATAVATIGAKTMCVLGPWWLGSSLSFLFFAAYSMVPVLLLHFTLVFPESPAKDPSRFLILPYCAAVILSVWSSWMYLGAAGEHSVRLFQGAATVFMVQNTFFFLLFLFSVANTFRSFRRASSTAERKKLRWIFYGLFIGIAPFIFLWVLPIAIGIPPWISEDAFKIFLLVIPVTMAIAILKYGIMDIDLIINRSAVYGIVIGFGLLIYLGVVGLVAELVTPLTRGTSMTISALTAAALALLAEPARRRVQYFVDRSFFRIQYDFREAERHFTEESGECLTAQQVASLLVDAVGSLIPVERIGFFLFEDEKNLVRVLSQRNFEMLEKHGIHIDAGRLKFDMDIPIALEESIEPGVRYNVPDREVLQRWAVALIVPLRGREERPLGFLVLGRKMSGLRFTAEDVDLVRAMSAAAARTIERIGLQQKLLFEQAESQRLDELNKLKSYFVSSVSHDLKTPLTSIKMFAELLRTKKGLRKSETKEYLGIIEGESERLSRLINNVLDFAKIERGVKEYSFSTVELNSLVRDVLKLMHYQFTMLGCEVHEAFRVKECALRADRDALAEAFINLLSNALKYSHEPRKITVTVFKRNACAAIRVADNGIGVAPGDVGHLFDPFYRTEAGKQLGGGGAGLGLSIVKHIVDAHKGTIEVASTVGKGSTFTLLLPLLQSKAGRKRGR